MLSEPQRLMRLYTARLPCPGQYITRMPSVAIDSRSKVRRSQVKFENRARYEARACVVGCLDRADTPAAEPGILKAYQNEELGERPMYGI